MTKRHKYVVENITKEGRRIARVQEIVGLCIFELYRTLLDY